MTLFTKDGDNSNNLFDMQCMWYEIEYGRSCLRSKAYGKALKKLRAVHTHFIDIIEDQFDFHTYCLRKMTLRAYVTLLRCEDSIYKHKFFRRAAHSLVECYMALHDNPNTASNADEDPELEGKSDLEKQKILNKRKKAAAKAAAAAGAEGGGGGKGAHKAAEDKDDAKGGKKGDGKKRGGGKEDEDPDGEALAKVDAPLDEATKYMVLLQVCACARAWAGGRVSACACAGVRVPTYVHGAAGARERGSGDAHNCDRAVRAQAAFPQVRAGRQARRTARRARRPCPAPRARALPRVARGQQRLDQPGGAPGRRARARGLGRLGPAAKPLSIPGRLQQGVHGGVRQRLAGARLRGRVGTRAPGAHGLLGVACGAGGWAAGAGRGAVGVVAPGDAGRARDSARSRAGCIPHFCFLRKGKSAVSPLARVCRGQSVTALAEGKA